LRHSAVTRLLDLGIDLRRVARFSRHRKLETLVKYDDNRQDLAGEMAATLAADV
jgi:integrase/recombinase XerC